MDQDEIPATAAGALVAAATSAVGITGPLEAIIGAAAFAVLQPVLATGFEWMGNVLNRGAKKSGRTVEQLVRELNTSPAKQELLIRALDAARRASLAGKREAMAEALAKGLMSDSAAAGETEFLRVIGDLDLAHLQALAVLEEPRPLDRNSVYLGQITFQPGDLGDKVPALRGREGRILAVLGSHGLAEQDTVGAFDHIYTPWQITSFGREVLARLTDIQQAVEDGEDT
jgi:hypothetical protein